MSKFKSYEIKIFGIYFVLWCYGRKFNDFRFLPKRNGFDHFYFLDYELIIFSRHYIKTGNSLEMPLIIKLIIKNFIWKTLPCHVKN